MRLVEVRNTIRDVFICDAHRCEQKIFSTVFELYETAIRPFVDARLKLTSDAADCQLDQRVLEGKYAVDFALQEVFACLLFLVSKEIIFPTEPAASTAPIFDVAQLPEEQLGMGASSSSSLYYVSKSQRVFCAQLFFFLCWNPCIPLDAVIPALYPLLATAQAAGKGREEHRETLENRIATDLLSDKRFAWQKRLVAEVLTGLVLCRAGGIKILYKVFILSDRVLDDATLRDAVCCVNSIIVSDANEVWSPLEDASVGAPHTPWNVSRRALTTEQQMQSVCQQLVDLMLISSADDEMEWEPRPAQTTGMEVPKNTVEERLHLALTLLANQLLHLPPKSDHNAYRAAYRRYFYCNKYFLTPAFSALTLRSLSATEEDVDKALVRLHTLLHGTQLGASPLAFMTVSEVVMPGLLHLTCLRDGLPTRIRRGVEALWKIIHCESLQVDFVAEIGVRACFVQTKTQFTANNCVEHVLGVDGGPCPPPALVKGLMNAVSQWDSSGSSLFTSKTVAAIAAHCHAIRAEAVEEKSREETFSALLTCLEKCLLDFPAASLFGTDALDPTRVLKFLNMLIPLSSLCSSWSIKLATRVLLAVTNSVNEETNNGDMSKIDVRRDERVLFLLELEKFQNLVETFCAESASNEDLALLGASVSHARAVLQQGGDNASDPVALSQSVEGSRLVATLERLHGESLQALEHGSVARLGISLNQLSANIEGACTVRVCAAEDVSLMVRESLGELMVELVIRVLATSADSFCAVAAIKVACWIGMYRWDSRDTSLLARRLYGILLASELPCHSPGGAASLRFSKGAANSSMDRLAVLKVRLLDLILSWCDYDHEGATLRHIDDYGRQNHRTGLFDLLSLLCGADQPDIVQVAALHCIGHYYPAVYPRVPLGSLTQLCKDVFRLTKVEMSKAACASMLLRVAAALSCMAADGGPSSSLAVLLHNDAQLRELKHLAEAMSHYYAIPTKKPPSSQSNVSQSSISQSTVTPPIHPHSVAHDELVRLHGVSILRHLSDITQAVLNV